MSILAVLKQQILAGDYNPLFAKLYGKRQSYISAQQKRYLQAIDKFAELFPNSQEISLFSAPGRTEVGGNHTDHQHGAVLAAAVNLDVIAVVSLNHSDTIRVQSQGFPMDTVDLADLGVCETDKGTSTAIIRGIASRFAQLGYAVGGFDAYTTSNVLKGSGLSSSASFENLIGTILNHAFNAGRISAVEIAQISQYAEVHHFGKACGLMDQMASSVGGFSSMDFRDSIHPAIEKIDFNFADCGYALCVVDTKGSHADLTPDYVAIPTEMKQVAAYFGKEVLREVDETEFYANIAVLRHSVSDRAILRAIHFFAENRTALEEAAALKQGDFDAFCRLVKSSGNSSFKFLQNIYSSAHPAEQGVSLGLALSERILGERGACRVHGGGFAGTIQSFVPLDLVEVYQQAMEQVFDTGSCYVLNIRPLGGVAVEV